DPDHVAGEAGGRPGIGQRQRRDRRHRSGAGRTRDGGRGLVRVAAAGAGRPAAPAGRCLGDPGEAGAGPDLRGASDRVDHVAVRRCRHVLWALACVALAGCGSSGAAGTRSGTTPGGPVWTHPVNGTILNAADGRPVAWAGVDGVISSAVADGHGGWYIAGGFTHVDGRPTRYLAHIR